MACTTNLIVKRTLLFYLGIVALFFGVTNSAPESALITQIPGFSGAFPSKHYSGYVTIEETKAKNLFYYFVESERKPSEDPVVLWLNGGPGCSSFDGFIYEHGPFNFGEIKSKGSLPNLQLNPYSWSKVSNVIYLDSPVGVGLSYSKNQSDYFTGDQQTASDSHAFLLKWFELYPEFVSNQLFIAGESYAGIYVPTLSNEVVKGIEGGIKPKLNFKGYLVGNGVTDDVFDGNALVPFAHGMGLISDDMFRDVTAACNGNFQSTNESCSHIIYEMDKVLNHLNVYDILEPCYHSPKTNEVEPRSRLPSSFRRLGEIETEKLLRVRSRMFGRAWPFRAPVKPGIVPTWPQILNTNSNEKSNSVPCTNDEVATAWLNDGSVRKALHVAEESLVGIWELCTSKILYDHDMGSMIPYHKNLTAKGYRALIYSGDHDMCVPYTGSEAWTRSLGYAIVDKWRSWYSNEQVAGYTQGYDHNLTFATIKGSGHTVPEYKPREALDFYSRFLAGNKL